MFPTNLVRTVISDSLQVNWLALSIQVLSFLMQSLFELIALRHNIKLAFSVSPVGPMTEIGTAYHTHFHIVVFVDPSSLCVESTTFSLELAQFEIGLSFS